MAKLSVNINKIATIRNARGGNNPDIVKVALDCLRFGADGITVHPRPDERHIRRSDVANLRPAVPEFNIEGYPDERFIEIVSLVRPTQVTLVPDSPTQLTSNHGWDTITHHALLTDVVTHFNKQGIRTSIFVNADVQMVEHAITTGTDRIELYTEPYASHYSSNRGAAILPFINAARAAREGGIGVNAGHDLNLDNLAYLIQNIPWIDEVSIGHALICDALYLGLEETIKRYKELCKI